MKNIRIIVEHGIFFIHIQDMMDQPVDKVRQRVIFYPNKEKAGKRRTDKEEKNSREWK